MKKFFVAMMVAFTMVMSVMGIGSEKAYAAENKQMTEKRYVASEFRGECLIDGYLEDLVWIIENYPEGDIEKVMAMDATIDEYGVVHIYVEAMNTDGEVLQDECQFSGYMLVDNAINASLIRTYGEQGIWEY